MLMLLVFSAPFLSCRAAVSLILNGDFANSLSSWNREGQVFDTGALAAFADPVVEPASLFQSVTTVPGFVGYQLSFDFLNGLSASAPLGFLRDTAFATLFFGDAPFGSSLMDGIFDTAIGLFDIDALGAFAVADGGSFGASSKGPSWSHYTLNQITAPEFADPGFVTIAFEFFDLNGIRNDSVFAIDNVVLTPVIVPEPSVGVLMVVAFGVVLRRRRRPSENTPQGNYF